MRDRFFQIKKLVIENVIWAERELKGRTGAEKKEIVIRKVMDTLSSMLPWYVRWGKELVAPLLLGRLTDLAARALNFMTGWNFGDVELTELQIAELACALDAPLDVIADSTYGKDIGEKIDELYHQYGVTPDTPEAGEIVLPATNHTDTRLSANLLRSEITCRCGCGFDSLSMDTVTLFQALRDFAGQPIHINSGCRCPEHNLSVGGSTSSPHIFGVALDFRVNGWTNRQFGEMIKEAHRTIPVVRELLRYCYLVVSQSGAVVHVDGSARPQTIARDANPLYYDVVSAFGRETGTPVLINTSFNVHEEPIVNKPGECAKALVDGRIDFVVTQRAIYEPAASRSSSEAAPSKFSDCSRQ